MKKSMTIFLCLISAVSCTRKKRVDDLAFKFCDKVTSNKSEYLKCFTDIVECYNQSSDQFDNDQKFIECARLFQVNEPTAQSFKYTPSIHEADLDEEIWREIENLDTVDIRRKNKKEKSETKPEPKPESKPVKNETPKVEYKQLPPEPELARTLPKEPKWMKNERLKKEAAEKAETEMTPTPSPQPTAPTEEKPFDF